VTRGEFAEFVTATGYRASAACVVDNKWSDDHDWQRPGFQQSANHPVVCVSWLDALAYVE
jgi:formylglycine-generating enzyme required for sulfatase activity